MAKSKKKSKKKTKKKSTLEYQGQLSIVLLATDVGPALLNKYVNQLNKTINYTELIVVGNNLDDTSIPNDESVQLINNVEQTPVAAKKGVEVATGEHILVVDNFAIAPRTIVSWFKEGSLPKDQVWLASRTHAKAELPEKYSLGLGGHLKNMLTNILTGILPQDKAGGFILLPKHTAKVLFHHLTPNHPNYTLEILHQCKMFDIQVVEQPILLKKETAQTTMGEAFRSSLVAWLYSWMTWFKHYFVHPIQENKLKHRVHKESPWFRFAFVLLALFLFILMPMISSDFGMTGDEHVQNTYGNKLLKYYESDGANTEALFYKDLYNYGGFYDYIAAWCNDKLAWFEDPYDMRHLLNSLFGVFMMFFVGLVGRVVTGSWLGGLLSLLFIALSPRMFGHSMNNPKDIPFAAAYLFTVYHAIQFTRQLPKPTLRTCLLVALGIATAINIRIGGLLLIAYLAAFSGITFLWRKELRAQLLNIPLMIKMLVIGGAIALVGFWYGTTFWPYGALDPLKKPFEVLDKMSNFYVGIRVLFDSTNFWSDVVPWNYIPNWMLYTTPLFVLFGFFASPILAFLRKEEGKSLGLVIVAFAGLFPIAYVIYQKSGLYDAMRHMLFAYCFFPILAAWTWTSIIKLLKPKVAKIGVIVVLVGLMALPTMFMVRNHPYQYTYFNELIGGIDGAYMKYESDYWMVSMKRLSEWFEKEVIAKTPPDQTIRVATNCAYPVLHYLGEHENVKVRYVRYHQREKKPWEYGLFFSRFINRDFLLSGVWPPGEIMYTEYADTVPLGHVIKRKSDPNAKAGRAFQKKKFGEAVTLLEGIINKDPKNESAMMMLIQAYLNTGQLDKMKQTLDKMMALSDSYSNTWGMKGIYHLRKKETEKARLAFEKAVDINFKYTFGNFHLARIYANKGENEKALECLEEFDAYGGKPAQGYDLGIQLARKTGHQVREYFFSAKKLSLQGKWPKAMQFCNQALAIDPDYAPAVKMKNNYEDAIARNKLKQQLKGPGKPK